MTQSHQANDRGDHAGQPAYRQVIRAQPGATVHAVLHGDMHVRNGSPVYRFDVPSLSQAAAGNPGVTRNEELARLISWRDEPAPGISALLVHGGDTQAHIALTDRFAAASISQRWTTWTARRLADQDARLPVAPGDPGLDLVTVVMGAGTWPVDDLQLLLENPLLRRARRARVLLVARSAGPWWPALRHRLGKAGIAVSGTMAIA